MEETGLEGLTAEELTLLEFGTTKEQLAWAVQFMADAYPLLTSRTLCYKTAASAIKKYGYRITAIGIKQLGEVTDKSLWAKMTYACSSIKKVEDSKRTTEEQKTELDSLLRISEVESRLSEVRKLCANPSSSLFKMFCAGEVTKEEYESSKGSDERCIELIKKVKKIGD